MSFIYRDSTSVPLALLNRRKAMWKHFDNAFPRHHLDSNLYGFLIYYYNGSFIQSERLKKFVVSIGMDWEEFINQDVDSEVQQLAFYVKPGFQWDGTTGFNGIYKDYDGPVPPEYDPTPSLTDPSLETISNTINDTFEVDDIVTLTVIYGGGLKRYIEEHELPWVATGVEVVSGGFDSATVESVLMSNPWYYLANSRHLPYQKNSSQFQLYNAGLPEIPLQAYENQGLRPADRKAPLATCKSVLEGYRTPAGGAEAKPIELGLFAFMDNGINWELVEGPHNKKTVTKTTGRDEGEVLEHKFDVKYRFIKTNYSSTYVKEIGQWYESYYTDVSKIPPSITQSNPEAYLEILTTSTIDSTFKQAMVNMMVDPSGGTNSLFTGGFLRADTAGAMKKRDFAKMIGQSLETDTGYKDATFMERAFAVVTIILAVVLVVVGLVVSFFVPPIGAVFVSAGTAVFFIGQIVLSAFGGASAAGWVKKIGVFAEITGYVAAVVGIYIAYQKIAAKAAEQAVEEAIEEGIGTSFEEVVESQSFLDVAKFAVNEAVDSAISKVTNLFGGTGSITQTVSFASDTVGFARQGYDLYNDKELEELNKEYAELEQETASLSEDLDSMRREADPLFTLNQGIEDVTTYDALAYLDLDWQKNHAPNAVGVAFQSERDIK